MDKEEERMILTAEVCQYVIIDTTVKATKHSEGRRDGCQQNEQVGAEQAGLYS